MSGTDVDNAMDLVPAAEPYVVVSRDEFGRIIIGVSNGVNIYEGEGINFQPVPPGGEPLPPPPKEVSTQTNTTAAINTGVNTERVIVLKMEPGTNGEYGLPINLSTIHLDKVPNPGLN